MSETIVQTREGAAAEAVLGEALARGDVAIGSIGPVLRHLLAGNDNSLFGDEIVARVRGMIDHLVRQLLDALDEVDAGPESRDYGHEQVSALADRLISEPALLAHIHALAVEWQLTERLQARLAIDPVLSPVLQGMIGASDPSQAAGGMALLAANARHAQAQRRMQLPLAELPADLFHLALLALRNTQAQSPAVEQAEARLRAGYDEGRSRLGLMDRLVLSLGEGATAALSVANAGVALFVTALALGAGFSRDMAILATHETQVVRLAVALRAAGAPLEAVHHQIITLHPASSIPDVFRELSVENATALLARLSAPVEF